MNTIKKISQQLFDFFIYSNLFISLAAFLFTVQTALLYNNSSSSASFFALTNFVSTFVMYNFQRIYQSTKPHNNAQLHWYEQNKRLLFTLILLIVSLYALVFHANYKIFIEGLLFYIPVGIVSLFYFLPPFTLRRLPFFKIFFISLVWVISSVFIPMLYNDLTYIGFDNLNQSEAAYLMAQFCFIAAICVPFDIRDTKSDQQNSIKTLPVQFGISKAKTIAIVLLLIYMLLAQDLTQTFVYLITGAFGILLVYFSKPEKHRHYFSYLVDGLIILQFFLALLFIG